MNSSKVKFGVGLPTDVGDFESMAAFAQLAEKLGFDSVWASDQVYFRYETLTSLSAIAARTRKVKLGTAVIDPNRRNPATLAHMISTLDIISKGRVILGIGKGAGNEECYGFPVERPVSRMREIIQIIKKFWTQPKVMYSGVFYEFRNASLCSKPYQNPHPPIWIGAFGSRMLKIDAELGDGHITQILSPKMYKEDLSKIDTYAKKIGRDPTEIQKAFVAPMAISTKSDDALKLISPLARRILALRAGPPRRLAERLGYKSIWTKPEDVPVEAIDQTYIYGTYEECISKIEKYIDVGARHFVALPILPSTIKSLKFFAKTVMGYFK